jgi:hypothetical protein
MSNQNQQTIDFPKLSLTNHVPSNRFAVRRVVITPALSLLNSMAMTIHRTLMSVGYTGNLTPDSLEKALVTLLKARVQQVCSVPPPRGYKWAEINVWSFMYPVLSSVGRFINETEGFEIIPALEGEEKGFLVSEDLDYLAMITRELAHWGLGYSRALPREVTVDTDDIYRLCITDGEVVGDAKTPSQVAVMSRLFYQMEFLSNVYCERRVVYATTRYLQDTFLDFMAGQIRTPSSIKT